MVTLEVTKKTSWISMVVMELKPRKGKPSHLSVLIHQKLKSILFGKEKLKEAFKRYIEEFTVQHKTLLSDFKKRKVKDTRRKI